MRIISKFKDYYDYGMIYGQDPNATYVRELKEVPIGSLPEGCRLSTHTIRHRGNRKEQLAVVIAGCRYTVYAEPKDREDDGIYDTRPIQERYKFTHNHDASKPNEPDSRLLSLAREHSAPVMVFGLANSSVYGDNDHYTAGRVGPDYHFDQDTVCLNPSCLAQIGFADVLASHEIFAIISNFILSINDKPMIEIGNKEKIAKAGFDLKSSFRHRP